MQLSSKLCNFILAILIEQKKCTKSLNCAENTANLKSKIHIFQGTWSNFNKSTHKRQKKLKDNKAARTQFLLEYSETKWKQLSSNAQSTHTHNNCQACFPKGNLITGRIILDLVKS